MTTIETLCLLLTALITGYMIWRYERLRKKIDRFFDIFNLNVRITNGDSANLKEILTIQSKLLNQLHASLSRHIKSKVHKRN